jgi:hypothetical protein
MAHPLTAWNHNPDSRVALTEAREDAPIVYELHECQAREGCGYILAHSGRQHTSRRGVGRRPPPKFLFQSPMETVSRAGEWNHVCNSIPVTTYRKDSRGLFCGRPIDLHQIINLGTLSDEEFYAWQHMGEIHVPGAEDDFHPSPWQPGRWESRRTDLRSWVSHLCNARDIPFGVVVIRGTCHDGLEAEYSNAISAYVNMRNRTPHEVFVLGNMTRIPFPWPEPGAYHGRTVLAAMPHLHGLSYGDDRIPRVYHANGLFEGRYEVTLQEVWANSIVTRDIGRLKERAWDKWTFQDEGSLGDALTLTGSNVWQVVREQREEIAREVTGGAATYENAKRHLGKIIPYWIPDGGCPQQIATILAERYDIREAIITLIGATNDGIRLFTDDTKTSDWYSPRYYEYMAVGRIRSTFRRREVEIYLLPGNDWGYTEHHGWLAELKNLNLGSAFIHVIQDRDGAYEGSIPDGLIEEGKTLNFDGGAREFLDMIGIARFLPG